ncbi:MAG: D-glycero-beta-D-manno-heptose 1,7-bisphosphate 7-phosphatase [Candidatus Altiarchaeota archaeon]|nr:D-glycero-beta-D-manno-heptose 1,7-bisphosphate 7-phosphatase [Candidatus Altiarchaeota archaeon]
MNKAVFLDRDGTINKEVNYLRRAAEFEFLPKAVDALRRLSGTDYKIIVVTNQSGVARGYLDENELKAIHEKMECILHGRGARIDRIYCCIHHPDGNCLCRKPDTGLIMGARREFNLSLRDSYMVGDSTRDIQTGINAGCKTILVKTGYAGRDGEYGVRPDYEASDLFDAVNIIIRNSKN